MVFLGAEAGQPMQKREKSFGKSSVLPHINVSVMCLNVWLSSWDVSMRIAAVLSNPIQLHLTEATHFLHFPPVWIFVVCLNNCK